MTQKELIELERELGEFSFKVFDYFNGKINKLNPCEQLVINPYTTYGNAYTSKRTKLMAAYNINYIELGLDVIMGNVSFDHFQYKDIVKILIICTIIHELYHADQRIEINMYSKDYNYAIKHEIDVDYMTYIYLLNNYDQINKDLGCEVTPYFMYNYFWETVAYNVDVNSIISDYTRFNPLQFYNQTFNRLFVDKNMFTNILYYEQNVNLIMANVNEIHNKDYEYSQIIIKDEGKFNTDYTEINDWISRICFDRIQLCKMYNSKIDDVFVIILYYDYINPIIIRRNPINFIQKDN